MPVTRDPAPDQFVTDIVGADETLRDYAVSIGRTRTAVADRAFTDLRAADITTGGNLGQGDYRLGKAIVAVFWGIDTAKADRLAGKVEGVAVDDP